jgi:hypothetical protein
VRDSNKIKHTAPVDVIFLQSPRFFSAIGKKFCPLKFCNKHIMDNVHFFVRVFCYACTNSNKTMIDKMEEHYLWT